jgi:hypothetical protein
MQINITGFESREVFLAVATLCNTLADTAHVHGEPVSPMRPDDVPDQVEDWPTGLPKMAREGDEFKPSVAEEYVRGQDPLPQPDEQQADDRPHDHRGVPYDENYCANAKDPFYSSGAQSGQWKKKRGVSEQEYAEWYSAQLPETDTAGDDDAPADVSSAFAPAPTADEPAPVSTAPQNCGDLMVWISEQQVAGKLTADQVAAAYAKHGLTITDLFAPNPDNVVARRVALLYAELTP